MRGEGIADLVGQRGPLADGGVDLRHARLIVEREATVQDLGAFREVGAVGDVEREIVGDLNRFVDAVAVFLHVRLVEIHVDRRFVDLCHTVLKPGLDAEFIELD